MIALHTAVFFVALFTYLLFIVGYYVFFRNVTKEGELPAGLRAIRIAAPIAKVTMLIAITRSGWTSDWTQYTALAMYLISAGIFLWAANANRQKPLTLAYSPDKPEHISQRGPYRFVRHPYYTSYLLAYYAAIPAAANLWLLPVAIFMTALYLHAAKTEEAKFAGSELATAYAEYRKQAGMFWPKIIN